MFRSMQGQISIVQPMLMRNRGQPTWQTSEEAAASPCPAHSLPHPSPTHSIPRRRTDRTALAESAGRALSRTCATARPRQPQSPPARLSSNGRPPARLHQPTHRSQALWPWSRSCMHSQQSAWAAALIFLLCNPYHTQRRAIQGVCSCLLQTCRDSIFPVMLDLQSISSCH